MKGRGQERCSHSQAQHGGIAMWNYVHVYECMCMHVSVCLCMYICLQSECLDLYFCAPWTSVLSVYLPHFLFLCTVALALFLLCVRVFVFQVLGVCYGKFTVISLASLPGLGFFSSCSCFNQPAGCTVAEGSTRGFTPLGHCPTITSPAALFTSTLSGVNEADETHKREN